MSETFIKIDSVQLLEISRLFHVRFVTNKISLH